MRWKSIHDWLFESEDHQLLRLCILAPMAGLMWLGSWAVFLVGAYFALKAITWWVAKSYESPESYFIWGIAPFLVFSVLAFIWTVLDLAVFPWLEDIWRERRRRRHIER